MRRPFISDSDLLWRMIALFVVALIAFGRPDTTWAADFDNSQRISISLCTSDTLANGHHFIELITPYLKVAKVRFFKDCAIPKSDKDGLTAQISQNKKQVRIEVGGMLDGSMHQGYSREIPWLKTTNAPLLDTIGQEKQVAFALLLETLLFDFEYIRLKFVPDKIPEGGIEDFTEETQDASISPNALDGDISAKAPISNAQTIDETIMPDKPEHAEPEKKAVTSEPKPQNNSEETKPQRDHPVPPNIHTQTDRDPRGFGIGIDSGIAYYPSDTVFVEVDVLLIKKWGKIRLFGMLTGSPWSNFTIQKRNFKTIVFLARVGAGYALVEKRPLSLTASATLQIRTNAFKRENLTGATYRNWVDFGGGFALLLHLFSHRMVGMVVMLGIDLFPTARELEIPDGPTRRFGFWSIPAKMGLTIDF